MGLFRTRTLFEQPVDIPYFVIFLFGLTGLCVLLGAEGVTSAYVPTDPQQPSPQQQRQPQQGHSQQPGGDGGLVPPVPHPRPLCPDGWVRGATGDQSFKDKSAGVCLYLSPQTLSWPEARDACHAKDSVLLSLDSVLSVEDRLFQQYLKDKGVTDVWTGMHKEGGRQLWDEPGKGMVLSYTGSQRATGLAKRGWSWDRLSFSDAKSTCGVYGYVSDKALGARRRRRRDSDTPGSTAQVSSASDTPNKEDSPPASAQSGPTEKNLESFKSFLSDQGMHQFADKMSDNPSDKAQQDKPQDSPSLPQPDPNDPRLASLRSVMPTFQPGRTRDPPQRATRPRFPPGRMGDVPGFPPGNQPPGMNVRPAFGSSDKPGDKPPQSPSQLARPANTTTEKISSDEDDSNHDIAKRSTPTMQAVVQTTEPPQEVKNVTASSNSTDPPALSSPPSSSATNVTSNSTGMEESSQRNDTSGGLFSPQSAGFSQELMDFFKTDSNEAPKQDSPITDANSTPPQEASVKDVFQRFQTGPGKTLGEATANSTANETQVASPAATAQSTAPTVSSTDSTQLNGSDGVSLQAGLQLNLDLKTSTQSSGGLDAVTDSQPAPQPSTQPPLHNILNFFGKSNATATAPATERTAPAEGHQEPAVEGSPAKKHFSEFFGPSAVSQPPVQAVTTESPLSSNTTAASSEEDTTDSSSSEHNTTTTASPTDSPDLLSDSKPSTIGGGFKQRFGTSSDTVTLPKTTSLDSADRNDTLATVSAVSNDTSAESSREVNATSVDSGEVTTTPGSADSAEVNATSTDSKEVDAMTTFAATKGAGFGHVTETSADISAEVNKTSTDSGEVGTTPSSLENSAEVNGTLADSGEVTATPSSLDTSAEVNETSTDSREAGTPPTTTGLFGDSAEVTDSGEVTESPATTEAGGDSVTDSQEVTTLPGGDSSEEVTTTAQPPGSSSVKGGTVKPEASSLAAKLRDALDSITAGPDHVTRPAGHSWMTLQHCQRKHQFVCAAKPVHDFLPVRKCDQGWLGHSLVPRCYMVVRQPASQLEAQSVCRAQRAELATADSAFFTNVTAMLLDRLVLMHGFEKRVWVSVPGGVLDPQCKVMEAQGKGVQPAPCDTRLPFFCQKNASLPDKSLLGNVGNVNQLSDPPLIINMTSWNPHHLQCPFNRSLLQTDDIIEWYKDGQPITYDHAMYSGSPDQLVLNEQLLRHLYVTLQRLLQPALLQGLYWCKVWRSHPIRTLTSQRIFVRFNDVVTLQGFIKTGDISLDDAVLFNEMNDDNGLPAVIGRGLQQMSDDLFPNMKLTHPVLSDVITIARHADAETDEVEFRTYLCLTVENMGPQGKGAIVDTFLSGLHTELVSNQDTIRRQWNLSLPFDEAFRLLMTEMCPEARLRDKGTGQEATFPSTPVNGHTLSVDNCNGEYVGYAECRGDLLSGAQWSFWQVDTPCYDSNTDITDDLDDRQPPNKLDPAHVVETGTGFVVPPKPKPGLLVLDEVHIEPENVADVTDRLADILNSSVSLTDVDVEIVADVIDRVALVPKLPKDVGMTLLKTVNRVLDSPLQTLRVAQRRTQASTRILKDLDKFSEKLDFGHGGTGHVRYVTPNIAMEVWNLRNAREPVIGLAATVGGAHDAPLTETRIMTLNNRTWADLNMANFDVAIELPDQLVSGDGVGNGRLSMAIYRRAGLFLSSLQADGSGSTEGAPVPELNSAIISATLASHSVSNLQDRVKLIFKPLKMAGEATTQCVYWDFSLPKGGGWSSKGCVYNGTMKGRDVCLCDHLTNFAVLLDFYGDDDPIGGGHETALSVITVIGLSLSILGLALTIITFIFFKKLRQGRAQQTLFNTAVALLCSEVLLLVGLNQTTNYGVCLAVAVLLHYFILVSFVWMLIEAVLQYLTFVKVLGTYISKYTLKTVLPAWGIPLIPVIAVLASDYTQYRGRKDYCWMKLDTFYYAFALPVGIIVLFNLVTFIVIMFSLLRRPEGLRSTKNKAQTAETNIKAAFTIFILLGLTWVFGYLAIADARLPFQYLFTASSSLQGFLIFVLLVARRRQFREQWQALCCRTLGRPARGQRVTPTLSNSTSSNTSGSSFTSSSRSRSSSGGSSKTLQGLIKRADSNVSKTKLHAQVSVKGSANKPR